MGNSHDPRQARHSLAVIQSSSLMYSARPHLFDIVRDFEQSNKRAPYAMEIARMYVQQF